MEFVINGHFNYLLLYNLEKSQVKHVANSCEYLLTVTLFNFASIIF